MKVLGLSEILLQLARPNLARLLGLELDIRIVSNKSLPLLSYLGNHMIVGGPRGWVPIPAFNIVLPAIVRMRHLILGLIASGFEMNFRFCGDYT